MVVCSPSMEFQDCELAILRLNVDKVEKEQGKILVESPETKKTIKIVEGFIKRKQLIIYGGTAINNILPKSDRFYNYNYELPDYDFFSKNSLEDAKELADIYLKNGFTNVEAKSGVHHGTYKVFVNNIGVADITYLHPEIFNSLMKDIITKEGLLYAPANFLRQSMYLELSRPNGEIDRWEKVLKRLILLNKYYPLKIKKCKNNIQREMTTKYIITEKKIFNIVKNCFIDEKLIFIGGYANALYSSYLPDYKVKSLPDFDVLSNDPLKTCNHVKKELAKENIEVTINTYPPIGELVAEHHSLQIGEEYIAFVYKPTACHSYNEIKIGNSKVKVGTIDTLLSFYMAFMYADRPYYDINRLLCLSTMLFTVQQRNRLKQSGLLKRFSTTCYGNQPTLSDIRDEKTKKRNELDPKSKEYEEWFLNYTPNKTKKNKPRKNKTMKKN
uniref:Poly(A) polymerase catalytic subunit domain-containing protein n=1 Tax=viral metagenome TaxID=1070528 RepID=A0A6C0B8E3_9ZZZZ